MKIAIVSDLHANLEALESFPEACDELWVLGDLVTYGPNPSEVVDRVRNRAALIVRGNHDHAAGTGEDPRCSETFRLMAEATLAFTRATLTSAQMGWLMGLPFTAERMVGRTRFFLCHAVPSDPLFAYCRPDSPRWQGEVENARADCVLVGHTHLPFVRTFDGRTVANPGSLGQPKNGDARACYAVWQDGLIELRSYEYPVEETVRKILAMPVPDDIRRCLANVLRSGGDPNRNGTDKET
jgi:predicted phosphodiesterase